MSVLNRKLIRDIIQTKSQIAAVVSIITLGIACLVGMYQTFNNLECAMASYYTKCRMTDFWVELKKAPVTIIPELQSLNGVSEIRNRIVFPVIIDKEDVQRPIGGILISMPLDNNNILDNIVMRSGYYFTSNNDNEVILSEKFSQARKIYPGDYINIVMNGIKKKLLVIGTAISSEYLYMTPPGGMAPDPINFGVFYVKRKLAEDIFNFHESFNSLVGKISLGTAFDTKITLNKIEEIMKPYGVFSVTPLERQFSNMTLVAELGGLKLMAYTMPIIFISLALMVLNIVMMRMAEQQRSIIGTLKALGYSNRDILILNLKLGFIIGLAGGVIGISLGYFFAIYMTNMYQFFFTFPDLKNRFDLELYLVSIILSVFFSVIGAYKGAKSMINLSPAEAMRQAPPQIYSSIFLEKFTFLWSRLGFSWQHIIRSVFRSPFRGFVGFICAAIGAGIIVMSLGMKNAFDYMMYFQYTLSNKADYIISFRKELPITVVQEIIKEPGVYKVIPEYDVSCTLQNGRFSKKCVIQGIIADESLVQPFTFQGAKLDVPKTGIVICKSVAKAINAKIGDEITILPIKGYQNPLNVKVSGIFETTFGIPVYADFKYLNKLTSQELSVSSVQIKAEQTEQQKIQFLNHLKEIPQLESLSVTLESKEDMQNNFISQMEGMIYSLIIFAAIIFFASILNSVLISISERKNEIATFKVLGYHNSEIGRMFFGEILFINIPGILLGLPLGYLFLYGMCASYQNDMYSIPVHFYHSTWYGTFIISIIFVLCAYLIARKAIDKLCWQEALNIKQ